MVSGWWVKKVDFLTTSHPDDTAAILVNQAAISEYEIEDPFQYGDF